jgi:hypothetical protein
VGFVNNGNDLQTAPDESLGSCQTGMGSISIIRYHMLHKNASQEKLQPWIGFSASELHGERPGVLRDDVDGSNHADL